MKISNSALLVLVVAGLSGAANAATINLNMGTAGTGFSTPGGLLGGTVNDIPLAGSGSIFDSTGGVTTVAVSASTGWLGDSNNDPDSKFNTAAGTYTDAVARSLFWGGGAQSVTISGLSASTSYAVGIVSASSNAAASHDWSFNGSLAADDLFETSGETSVPYFLGTTDGAGTLVITSNAHSATALLQAIVIDDDLALVPEPGSLALLGLGGLVLLRRRRG